MIVQHFTKGGDEPHCDAGLANDVATLMIPITKQCETTAKERGESAGQGTLAGHPGNTVHLIDIEKQQKSRRGVRQTYPQLHVLQHFLETTTGWSGFT